MSEAFEQNLQEKGPRPGGPFIIQLLFRDPVPAPDKEDMTEVLTRRCGAVERFCYDEKTAGFAALDHVGAYKDGKVPAQLMITACHPFDGRDFDPFLKSQMWDCMDDRERILRECRYQVVATDMLAAALPALERAELDMNFLAALAELYPACEAFYFPSCGKLFLAGEVRECQIPGPDRFIRFGVNARFFRVQDTEDMMVDTVGMSTLFLPDLQYHFRGMEPDWVVNHAYSLASYILQNDTPIESDETVDGIVAGEMSRQVQWKCQYEEALIQPPREVLDIHMGEYAAGLR
ncbi:MAG: DUF4261 domain-containing protein [Clostridiales bacterium]|nr:DUF4261 domain-containing protein [Clostridiales bacterium]